MKMNHVRYLSGKEQDRMIDNGWRLMLPNTYSELPEPMFERLSKVYDKVKIYYDTTMVRGCHKYFAMVK